MYQDIPFRDSAANLIDSHLGFQILNDVLVDFESGLIYDPKTSTVIWEAANEQLMFSRYGWLDQERSFFAVDKIKKLEIVLERMRQLQDDFELKLRYQKNIKEIKGTPILNMLSPVVGSYMYGHIFDILQKNLVARKNKLYIGGILCSRHSEIIDFDQHIDAIGLGHVKKYVNKNNDLVRVATLIYIRPLARLCNFTEESFNFIQQRYFEYFDVNTSVKPSKKVFLTRNKTLSRYLINSEQILPILRDNSIEILDGTESLETVVTTLASSSHVAGIHGSLFMNNVFCTEKTKFLEYCPAERFNAQNFSPFKNQYKLSTNYTVLDIPTENDQNIFINDEQLANLLSWYSN